MAKSKQPKLDPLMEGYLEYRADVERPGCPGRLNGRDGSRTWDLGGSDDFCAVDVALGEDSFAKSSVLLAARGAGHTNLSNHASTHLRNSDTMKE